MAVSKRLRYEILRRDNHACRYCGATAPGVKLVVDHVTPTALGGTDAPSNLITACEPCNSGKSSVTPDGPLVDDVAQDQLRWTAAIKQAAADMEAAEAPKLAYRRAFEKAWKNWTYNFKGKAHPYDLPEDWRSSVERYRLSGLPASFWPDIIEPAMTNPTVKAESIFRYTCGVANHRVAELQAAARKILAPVDPPATPLGQFEEAVVAVWTAAWVADFDEQPGAENVASFRASMVELRDVSDVPPVEELAKAAAFGVVYGSTTIQDCLTDLAREARSNVVMAWANAWFAVVGEFPDGSWYSEVAAQCDQLIAAGAMLEQLKVPAIAAGLRMSRTLHVGLSDDHLSATKTTRWRVRAEEVWAEAFTATARRWPTSAERSCFGVSLRRAVEAGGYTVGDVYSAATSAGAYMDTDLRPCLPAQMSALLAAERIPAQSSP